MAVDFSAIVYLPTQDLFGRDMIFTPLNSNPGAPAYTMRGIWTTREIAVMADVDTMAMINDQQTIVDIRDREFFEAGYAIPVQGDLVEIPAENEIPAEGLFEITDRNANGGGETTFIVRKYVTAAP